MNEALRRRLRDRSTGAATLINEGCKITGMIVGNGDFLVNGEIEGDSDIDGTVTLARNGYWRGTIKADTVIVAGHVEGDVIAAGKVEIGASAKIIGTVSGDAIAVAEGAVVEGVMKTTGKADPIEFVEKRKPDV
jgi:cytoskeletal protein CcmA (bactofilin family)